MLLGTLLVIRKLNDAMSSPIIYSKAQYTNKVNIGKHEKKLSFNRNKGNSILMSARGPRIVPPIIASAIAISNTSPACSPNSIRNRSVRCT